MPNHPGIEVGYDNPHTDFKLRYGAARVGISEPGGYITDWWVSAPRGHTVNILHLDETQIKRTGIPTLVPHYGPSETQGQHGFGRTSTWKYTSLAENAGLLTLTPELISEEARKAYPHDFLYTAKVSLGRAGILRHQLNMVNLGDDLMPVMPGFHPYFKLPLDAKPYLKIPEIPTFNASEIDWKNDEHDTEYPFEGNQLTLFMHDVGKIVKITKGKSDSNTRRAVIWSPPGTDYICIEPVSGKIGQEFETDPHLVGPGQNFSMDISYEPSFMYG